MFSWWRGLRDPRSCVVRGKLHLEGSPLANCYQERGQTRRFQVPYELTSRAMKNLAWNLEMGAPSCRQACKGSLQARSYWLCPQGLVILKAMQGILCGLTSCKDLCWVICQLGKPLEDYPSEWWEGCWSQSSSLSHTMAMCLTSL